jgi:hypothetical protein
MTTAAVFFLSIAITDVYTMVTTAVAEQSDSNALSLARVANISLLEKYKYSMTGLGCFG